jgi:hypothetical protein
MFIYYKKYLHIYTQAFLNLFEGNSMDKMMEVGTRNFSE